MAITENMVNMAKINIKRITSSSAAAFSVEESDKSK
jgi:hypothetical protein